MATRRVVLTTSTADLSGAVTKVAVASASVTGPTGPQGATGATGATGPQGPSGVIAVTAPVTNSGTSTSAQLGLDQTALSITASQVSDGTTVFARLATSNTFAGRITASETNTSTTGGVPGNGNFTQFWSATTGTVNPYLSALIGTLQTSVSAGATYSLSASEAAGAVSGIVNVTGAGTYSTLVNGVIASIRLNQSGTLSSATDVLAYGYAGSGTGTITNKIGVRVNNQSNARVSNSYGVQVQAQGTGFAFYSFGGRNVYLAGDAANVVQTVQGAVSQSANLQEWQDSSSVVRANVTAVGQIETTSGVRFYTSTARTGWSSLTNTSGNLSFNYPFALTDRFTVTAGAATTVPATVNGAAAQTANLTEWKNSGGSVLALVDAYGSGAFGSSSSLSASLGVQTAGNAAQKAIVVRGAAAQTAVLVEWQNSAGAQMGFIGAEGRVRAPYFQTGNARGLLAEASSGAYMILTKMTAALTNPGAGLAGIYFRDGTTAGTLKLVVRAGAAGAETTILDDIPQ